MSTVSDIQRNAYARRAMKWGLFNSVVSAMSVALALPAIISTIGLTSYGYWALLALFVSTAGAADLGIARSLVINMAAGHISNTRALLSAGLLIAFLLSAGISAALVMADALDSSLWGSLTFERPSDGPFLLACGISAVFLYMSTSVMRGVLEGGFDVHWVSIGSGVQTILYYLFAFVLASTTRSWRSMVVGSLAAYLTVAGFHFIQLRRRYGPLLTPPPASVVRAVFREGVRTSAALLPAAATLPTLGYLYVRQASGAADYGTFDLAIKICLLIGTAITVAGLPMLSIASKHRTEPTSTRNLALRLTAAAVSLYFIALLCLWIVGPTLIALVVPDRGYEVALASLAALSGAGLLAAADPLSRTLLGLGHNGPTFMARLIMLVAALLAATTWANDGSSVQRFAASYAIGCGACAVFIVVFFLRATARRPH